MSSELCFHIVHIIVANSEGHLYISLMLRYNHHYRFSWHHLCSEFDLHGIRLTCHKSQRAFQQPCQ